MNKNRKKIKGSNILVTGGAGFIGSHLVEKLIQHKAKKVVIVDNLFLGSKANLKDILSNDSVYFYNEDAESTRSLEYIFSEHQIDIVFNCATKALNYSFINPAEAFSTNVEVILNLLECQRKGLFSTLCHFSTSEVYGTAIYEPMDEDHPTRPTTSYAAGKSAADMALQSYVRMFGLDSFIVRPFNNYGPRQNHTGPLAGIIPITITKIMKNQSPEIHGTGNQTRDFIYVHDTVDIVIKLFEILNPGQSVNISTQNQISISSLVEILCQMMSFDGQIQKKPSRSADVDCHNASNELVKSLVPFELTPFDKGLAETIQWYKLNL